MLRECEMLRDNLKFEGNFMKDEARLKEVMKDIAENGGLFPHSREYCPRGKIFAFQPIPHVNWQH